MKRGYGQYCPLALATELLCERWTLLIVSRLIDGCLRFNEIHRSLPRISLSLLAQRLDHLEHNGLVKRAPTKRGTPRLYELTPAARALTSIIEQLAIWGQQWARDMTVDDLDPGFIVWTMHLWLDIPAMPASRTVVQFEFSNAPKDCRCFWLVAKDGKVEMCLKDPGYEVDLKVAADLLGFIEAWRGIRDLRKEIQSGRIRLIGSRELCERFPSWLRLSAYASFARQRPGREQKLATARDERREPSKRLQEDIQR